MIDRGRVVEKPESPLTALWAETASPRKSRRISGWALAAGAVVLVTAGIAAWRMKASPAAPEYRTATVARQTITRSISATGTIEPVTTVQVGTQVSGTISELMADYNSTVKKDQIIARLDPSQFNAQLAQANGTYLSTLASVQAAQNNVTAADAAVTSAQANVDHMQAALNDAQASFDRTKKLVDAQVAAQMTLETAQSTLDQAAAQKQQAIAQVNQARAQAQSARSAVAQAQAQANQAKAAVDLAQVNLDHTIIRAPIDGVVIARNVDVGQTVAASLQAPVIYLIANDLTRMQVLANIDEADVGQLAQGSEVNFTVDAYPSQVFTGTVSQVRLSPQSVQNVVTYTAVIDVRNPDLKLKPGMTANVNVVAAQHENVLAIPNSALRFRATAGQSKVWKESGGQLVPVKVTLGLSDGISSEVVAGDLQEGDRVAIPSLTSANNAAKAPVSSPFAPGGGRKGR